MSQTIREFWQAKTYWKHYKKSWENVLEIVILLSGVAYLISLTIYPLYSSHFAAWTVFLSWFEMLLMLGRIPSIGIFIYMSTYVLKTLSVFLMVYSPLLIAFGATFHILLPNKTSFSNFGMALMKASVTTVLNLEKAKLTQSRILDAKYRAEEQIFAIFRGLCKTQHMNL